MFCNEKPKLDTSISWTPPEEHHYGLRFAIDKSKLEHQEDQDLGFIFFIFNPATIFVPIP
jgi:hypothetical protein